MLLVTLYIYTLVVFGSLVLYPYSGLRIVNLLFAKPMMTSLLMMRVYLMPSYKVQRVKPIEMEST